MSIAQFQLCLEPSFPNQGSWRIMRVAERRLKGQCHPWWGPKRVMSIFLLKVCQKWRRSVVGYFEDIEGHVYPWCYKISCLSPRKLPWKFCVNILFQRVSRLGDLSWGYLEDVECSREETWSTGKSITSLMTLFDPKEDTLIFLFLYHYCKCV